ncbi:MAG: hypothetical protein IJA71_04890, partial [Clostridia bacterium]|nr:hypothetical protein [Clostridia bacterium]
MKKLSRLLLALLMLSVLLLPALELEVQAYRSIYLRVYDRCTNTYMGIPIHVTGNGVDVTVYNTDDLVAAGLEEGRTYTFSASYDGYETPTTQITLPRGTGSSADVNYYVYKQYDVTVTVRDTLGQPLSGQSVQVSHPDLNATYTTDGNGQFTVKDIRGLFTVKAQVTVDGETVSGSVIAREDQSLELTVPLRQKVSVKLTNGSADITQATVTVGDARLTHVGGNVYEGSVVRTAQTVSLPLKISAKGYVPVEETVSVGGSPLSKTYALRLLGASLVDGSGTAVAGSVELQTGSSYVWTAEDSTVPEGAVCTLRDVDGTLDGHVALVQSGNSWTVTPTAATSSAGTLRLEYRIGSETVASRDVRVTVARGSCAYPAAPTLTSPTLDASAATFRLPADLKLAKSLTVTATGGEEGISVSQTYTDLSSGTVTLPLSDGVVRGRVSFSFAYTSDAVDYTGSAPGSSADFYALVARRSLAASAFEYTGSPIKPTVGGSEVASHSYASYCSGDYPFMIQEEAAPTGLTSDNTLTFQLIPGLGSPQTYYSCPYGVTVRLKPYYTVGTDGSGGYITSYTLFYTVVPRSLTVIAEDQTIPYATQPANSVRAGDGQLLPGHSVTATVRLDSARTGLEVEEGSVKVWDGTTDVSKYYDVTAYVPGILTATQSATTVRIPDSYPRDYVYGDTVALPEAEVTGAYASDVRYVWTDSQGAPVEQPRNAGSYTLTASIDETAQTTASSDSVQITIGKRPVTVTSLTASKVYDGTGSCDALQALTVELSGLVESETLLTGTDLRVGSLALSDPQGLFA